MESRTVQGCRILLLEGGDLICEGDYALREYGFNVMKLRREIRDAIRVHDYVEARFPKGNVIKIKDPSRGMPDDEDQMLMRTVD